MLSKGNKKSPIHFWMISQILISATYIRIRKKICQMKLAEPGLNFKKKRLNFNKRPTNEIEDEKNSSYPWWHYSRPCIGCGRFRPHFRHKLLQATHRGRSLKVYRDEGPH